MTRAELIFPPKKRESRTYSLSEYRWDYAEWFPYIELNSERVYSKRHFRRAEKEREKVEIWDLALEGAGDHLASSEDGPHVLALNEVSLKLIYL